MMLHKEILGSRPQYRVTVSTGSGGTASVNKQYASAGETVTISISAYSNYRIDSVTVTGTTVSGSGSTRTFVMPSQNVTVSVSFYYVAPSYSISLSTGSGGTARLSTTSATAGTRVYIYITPSTGYEISSVSASGASVSGSGTTYYFTMPSRSVSVSVSFKQLNRYVWAVYADKDSETEELYLAKIPESVFNAADNSSRYIITNYRYTSLAAKKDGKVPVPYYSVAGNLLLTDSLNKEYFTSAIKAKDCVGHYQTIGTMKNYWRKCFGNPVAID